MPSQIIRSSARIALPWGSSRIRLQLLVPAIGLMAISVVLTRAQNPLVVLHADLPGIGIVDQRFMIAMPIANDGTVSATNVRVTGATWGSAHLISPSAFPVQLGTIGPGYNYVFQTDFDAAGLAQDTMNVLTITGTYQVNLTTSSFTLTIPVGLPPTSPGSRSTEVTTAHSHTVSGGPFQPVQGPDISGEINEPPPPIPVSPLVPGLPTPQSTSPLPLPVLGAIPAPTPSLTPAVTINVNQGLGSLGGLGAPKGTLEPSGGSGGGVVFVSFNNAAAYSSGGGPFNVVVPGAIFPTDGYVTKVTDQWVQYVPQIDRFLWLQMLTQDGPATPGAFRLATASPAVIKKYGGTGWTYWILEPDLFEMDKTTQYDFPSMSVGNNYLYISWDNGCPKGDTDCPKKHEKGREVVRIPLEQIQDGGDIQIRYTDPHVSGGCSSTDSCVAWADFLTQDTGDEVFWAGQKHTTGLRVFSWAEGSDVYYWRDVRIKSWKENSAGTSTYPHYASYAPFPEVDTSTPKSPQNDNEERDWLYRRSAGSITGATRSGNKIWFAWNAAPSGTFTQPYIEMVTLDRSAGFAVTQQVQIWNPTYAFGLPSLSTNACTGEIGLSLAYGGGGNYPNHAVGFWGDYAVYTTTTADVTTSYYGDYVTIRQNFNSDLHGAFFDAFGYAIKKSSSAGTGNELPTNQTEADIRHVVFGRPGACGK